jgi:hypothetical protein
MENKRNFKPNPEVPEPPQTPRRKDLHCAQSSFLDPLDAVFFALCVRTKSFHLSSETGHPINITGHKAGVVRHPFGAEPGTFLDMLAF